MKTNKSKSHVKSLSGFNQDKKQEKEAQLRVNPVSLLKQKSKDASPALSIKTSEEIIQMVVDGYGKKIKWIPLEDFQARIEEFRQKVKDTELDENELAWWEIQIDKILLRKD